MYLNENSNQNDKWNAPGNNGRGQQHFVQQNSSLIRPSRPYECPMDVDEPIINNQVSSNSMENDSSISASARALQISVARLKQKSLLEKITTMDYTKHVKIIEAPDKKTNRLLMEKAQEAELLKIRKQIQEVIRLEKEASEQQLNIPTNDLQNIADDDVDFDGLPTSLVEEINRAFEKPFTNNTNMLSNSEQNTILNSNYVSFGPCESVDPLEISSDPKKMLSDAQAVERPDQLLDSLPKLSKNSKVNRSPSTNFNVDAFIKPDLYNLQTTFNCALEANDIVNNSYQVHSVEDNLNSSIDNYYTQRETNNLYPSNHVRRSDSDEYRIDLDQRIDNMMENGQLSSINSNVIVTPFGRTDVKVNDREYSFSHSFEEFNKQYYNDQIVHRDKNLLDNIGDQNYSTNYSKRLQNESYFDSTNDLRANEDIRNADSFNTSAVLNKTKHNNRNRGRPPKKKTENDKGKKSDNKCDSKQLRNNSSSRKERDQRRNNSSTRNERDQRRNNSSSRNEKDNHNSIDNHHSKEYSKRSSSEQNLNIRSKMRSKSPLNNKSYSREKERHQSYRSNQSRGRSRSNTRNNFRNRGRNNSRYRSNENGNRSREGYNKRGQRKNNVGKDISKSLVTRSTSEPVDDIQLIEKEVPVVDLLDERLHNQSINIVSKPYIKQEKLDPALDEKLDKKIAKTIEIFEDVSFNISDNFADNTNCTEANKSDGNELNGLTDGSEIIENDSQLEAKKQTVNSEQSLESNSIDNLDTRSSTDDINSTDTIGNIISKYIGSESNEIPAETPSNDSTNFISEKDREKNSVTNDSSSNDGSHQNVETDIVENVNSNDNDTVSNENKQIKESSHSNLDTSEESNENSKKVDKNENLNLTHDLPQNAIIISKEDVNKNAAAQSAKKKASCNAYNKPAESNWKFTDIFEDPIMKIQVDAEKRKTAVAFYKIPKKGEPPNIKVDRNIVKEHNEIDVKEKESSLPNELEKVEIKIEKDDSASNLRTKRNFHKEKRTDGHNKKRKIQESNSIQPKQKLLSEHEIKEEKHCETQQQKQSKGNSHLHGNNSNHSTMKCSNNTVKEKHTDANDKLSGNKLNVEKGHSFTQQIKRLQHQIRMLQRRNQGITKNINNLQKEKMVNQTNIDNCLRQIESLSAQQKEYLNTKQPVNDKPEPANIEMVKTDPVDEPHESQDVQNPVELPPNDPPPSESPQLEPIQQTVDIPFKSPPPPTLQKTYLPLLISKEELDKLIKTYRPERCIVRIEKLQVVNDKIVQETINN